MGSDFLLTQLCMFPNGHASARNVGCATCIAIVVAGNIKIPGAPMYHAYMKEQEGKLWRSREHKSFAEYQSVVPDMVLESDYSGD